MNHLSASVNGHFILAPLTSFPVSYGPVHWILQLDQYSEQSGRGRIATRRDARPTSGSKKKYFHVEMKRKERQEWGKWDSQQEYAWESKRRCSFKERDDQEELFFSVRILMVKTDLKTVWLTFLAVRSDLKCPHFMRQRKYIIITITFFISLKPSFEFLRPQLN